MKLVYRNVCIEVCSVYCIFFLSAASLGREAHHTRIGKYIMLHKCAYRLIPDIV